MPRHAPTLIPQKRRMKTNDWKRVTLAVSRAVVVVLMVMVAVAVCGMIAQAADSAGTAVVADPLATWDKIAPASDAVSDAVSKVATKYPWVSTVLFVVGACRFLLKPTFTFLHSVVAVTPSTKDDEWLARVESSTALKWLSWGLDWLFSIKLTHPKAIPAIPPSAPTV